MSKELINETKCPVCKKVFAYTPMWVYKRRACYICSYKCTTEYDRRKRAKIRMSNKDRNEKVEILTKLIDAGCTITEMAEKTGMNLQSVKYYCKKIIAEA